MEAGDIKDADTLKAWLGVMLAEGGGYCDAVLFAHAHRATRRGDDKALRAVAELAAAFAPSKERHLETTAQGNAFVEATRAAWACAALERLKKIWDGPVAYPVAVAVAAAGHGIALEPALAAYLQAVAANWVSAGVRLIPLGQSDGQRVLAALEPVVAATAQRALTTKLDDIGSPPSAPTSPARGTRRNTRGCFGREAFSHLGLVANLPHARRRDGRARIDRAGSVCRLAALQHVELAVQQIGGIEARMRVQAGIHMRRHFDQHHHRFVIAVRHVESFKIVRVMVPACSPFLFPTVAGRCGVSRRRPLDFIPIGIYQDYVYALSAGAASRAPTA